MFRIMNWRAGARGARRLNRFVSACVEALEDRRLLAGYQVELLDSMRAGDLAGGLSNNGSVLAFRDGASAVRRGNGRIEEVPGSGMDLNESGDVVGFFEGVGGRRAFVYSGGVVTELPGFEGTASTEAIAINSSGVVVGQSRHADGFSRGVIWRDGVPESLGTLGGRFSVANDVNNDGQVVGEAGVTGSFFGHAFLYEDGVMRDLGVLNTIPTPFAISSAQAVNDQGWVVGGSSSDTQGLEAFVWIDGVMTGLDALPGGRFSLARDVNDSGVVVGESTTATGLSAFVWTQEGEMVDLNSLIAGEHVRFVSALNVNNRGQILAVGQDTRLYLLTPSDEAVAASPETAELEDAGEEEESVFGEGEVLLA